MHTLHRDQVMEKKVISKFYHEHPLILTKNVSNDERGANCYGCGETVANTEMVYVCAQEGCSEGCILHRKCGELPNQIWHPQHSKHPMNLFSFHKLNTNYYTGGRRCRLCTFRIYNKLGYRCSSCDFNVHRNCVEASIEARDELEHQSHPLHPLTLMRRPAFSFYCDGCGDEDVDTAYVCSTCEFWLHKRCATSLPSILSVDEECNDHHHPLPLVFSLPKKHCRYNYRCNVCSKYCDPSCWSYFCDECRYIVHIKCAIRSKPDDSNLSEDGGDVIELPLHANDISHKLIKPFVMREKGLVDTISTSSSTSTNTSYLLEYYHEHPLRYVSEFIHKDEEDEEEDDEEDIEEESKICDVCITPISNSSYYECATSTDCTYYIHSICSLLPHTLQHSSSSSNLNSLFLVLGECVGIPNKIHNFTLYKSKGRDAAFSHWECDLCALATIGMGYECGDCGKMIDVKCASLPTSIRHASHTRCHRKPLTLSLVSPTTITNNLCHVCNESNDSYDDNIRYCCSQGGCDFSLHLRCAMFPLSIKDREWDKHQLMLTSDASLDHPSDFYCEFCEREMHPKNWMYHCRHCDASLHLYCLDTGSGYWRNMKFGKRYEFEGIHPNHSLTFTCVTLKKHCDLCHERECVYTYPGFECATCYYVLCCNCGFDEYMKKKQMSLC